MSEILAIFSQMRWNDVADIALVTFVFYQILLLLRGTRAMQMLLGLGVVFVILFVSHWLNLLTINWIINSFLSSLILVMIILFQPDIRRALARIGRRPFGNTGTGPGSTVEEVVRAAVGMAARMIGCLIVLERQTGLAEYVEVGTWLDSAVSREILITIFQPASPLHDGAVIISGDRIQAARCLLPLSTSPQAGRHLGTRHRAALGLSEESDAVCVVVSEERGRVSMAVEGKLIQDLDATALRKHLSELLVGKQRSRGRLRALWNRYV